MPDVRYICLSDLHLGEEDSLLTNLKTDSSEIDTKSPSPVLENLANCFSELVVKCNTPNATKPTLILNGDILELALCTMDKAAMVFEQFISCVMRENDGLFGEIIFLPGNHDHHLWETARETQYLNYIMSKVCGERLNEPWHTTKLFMNMAGTDRLVNRFLTGVIQRFPHLKEFEITTAYPNFGILPDNRRCVIFHHDHFIEPLYHLMSRGASEIFPGRELPNDIYTLEEENFAWIDFFWSMMGRSGRVGRDIERVYEMLRDPKGREDLLDSLAKALARKIDIPNMPDVNWLEKIAFKNILSFFIKEKLGKQERQQADARSARTLSRDCGGIWKSYCSTRSRVKTVRCRMKWLLSLGTHTNRSRKI